MLPRQVSAKRLVVKKAKRLGGEYRVQTHAEELVESLCTTGPIRTGLGTPSHVNVASPLKQAKRGLASTPLFGPLKFLPYAAMRVRDQAFPLLPLHPRPYVRY